MVLYQILNLYKSDLNYQVNFSMIVQLLVNLYGLPMLLLQKIFEDFCILLVFNNIYGYSDSIVIVVIISWLNFTMKNMQHGWFYCHCCHYHMVEPYITEDLTLSKMLFTIFLG